MLEARELEHLYEVLNKKDDTLQEIEAAFLTIFTESLAVFRASYCLSNLINLNLLTAQQRIIAIFLLIENFKSEGIKKHPFGATILNVSQRTTESFERKLIADIIIDSKRDKYAKAKIDTLFDQQQVMIEHIEERVEIKKLRDQFVANLPKIPQSKKSEVHNVISDFGLHDQKSYPPEQEVSRTSIKEQELSNDSYNVGFLRPIPKFIDILPSEFNWLSPGIISDVHWDNSAEVEKKLTKSKALMKKAMDHSLSKEQCTDIQRVLDSEPYAVLNMEVSVSNINTLIKVNPAVATIFLIKLSNYPIVAEYLESILYSAVSLNSIDVISRFTKNSRLPNEFLKTYTLNIMKESQCIPENHKDRAKIPRIIAVFIKAMTKNRVLDLNSCEEQLDKFINTFIDVEQIQNLKKTLSE